MTKFNRREYLKRMAAGTVGAAGAAALARGDALTNEAEHFDSDRATVYANRPSQPQKPRTTTDDPWPPSYNKPARDELVTVVFGGLMGFFHNPLSGTCDIGFHPGDGMHQPQIQIYEIPQVGKCREVLNLVPIDDAAHRITFDVIKKNGAPKEPNVKFYRKDSNPFDRYKGEPEDFRWLLDLDSGGFYPKNFRKKRKFNHALILSQGSFYTRTISNSTFVRVGGPGAPEPLGHMPMYMAAAVPLETDEYVVIKLLSLGSAVPQTLQTHTLYQRAGSKFEVHFLNGCDQDECEWDYTSTNEKKRNDFHFMREVLDLPFGEKKYGLKIEVKAPIGATADVCPYIKFRNTDEAPCMGAGYGGGGFPSVP